MLAVLPTTQPATPLDILYEDADILVVNKPAGLVTHPAYKNLTGTLTDQLAARQAALGAPQPWLLHRLDRDTSGILLFAKTPDARRDLARQFERHLLHKTYLALTVSAPAAASGLIDAPLRRDPTDRRRVISAPDGQTARTHYHVLAERAGHTFILAQPTTGRTHQIRAHLALIGAPICGDATYLPARADASEVAPSAPRAMLHAWTLTIIHPTTRAWFLLRAPLPADLLAHARLHGLPADDERLRLLASAIAPVIPMATPPA